MKLCARVVEVWTHSKCTFQDVRGVYKGVESQQQEYPQSGSHRISVHHWSTFRMQKVRQLSETRESDSKSDGVCAESCKAFQGQRGLSSEITLA